MHRMRWPCDDRGSMQGCTYKHRSTREHQTTRRTGTGEGGVFPTDFRGSKVLQIP